MNASNKLLSDIVTFRTYSRHLPTLGRRESFEETINRNMSMHLDRFPKLSKEIIRAYTHVHDLDVMPSMRGMQFAGQAVLKNNCRQFNCAFLPIDDVRAFGETLFLLLSGTGVGFSVQDRHVNQLPRIQEPREEGAFLVQDSIIGWAQAIDVLFEAYAFGRVRPIFDFFQIRPKGALLVTTGAKAPGSEPLKHMLIEVEKRLKKAIGRKLSDIEAHDVVCLISDCVLAGGIRRAALVSLFDRDSTAMLNAKSGEWWIQHPYRARANNSAVLPRGQVTREEFDYIFSVCQKSNCGEPGFFWSNDLDNYGSNPCMEVSLLRNQFCNLTTINQTGISNKKDFLARVEAATFIGTLQATYTDFPYLRPQWQINTEADALIGVSFTGIADSSGIITDEWLRDGAQLVLDTNTKYAKKTGINKAARTTVLKPEGSSSATLGSSSGVHDRHAPFYLRRIRASADDALVRYLKSVIPGLVEDAVNEANTVVITIPQESPEGAICRKDSTALSLLDRIMMYNRNWIKPGHVYGANRNNVSATVSVRENEWKEVREYMWKNHEHYTGIALLPYDLGKYMQAPFENCTKEEYEELSKQVADIDLRNVVEIDDNTTRADMIACGGQSCEIR